MPRWDNILFFLSANVMMTAERDLVMYATGLPMGGEGVRAHWSIVQLILNIRGRVGCIGCGITPRVPRLRLYYYGRTNPPRIALTTAA